MADNTIQVPNNIEDKTVLKRFLTQLVLGINSNGLLSNNKETQNAAIVEILQNNPTLDFLNLVSKLTELRTDILTYVDDNIETIILQNTEDIAVIAEQFGTFYNQALAASWYGLSVKAGGAVAGLEVGSLDPDVTTPGDESSYFRVISNNFILGRAYEDLTQAEKDYLATHNLPNFGTVYDVNNQPVPALVTTWDGANQVYKHYFNGIVQFSNISGADYANAINNGTTTINGGKITTNTLSANRLTPSTNGTTVWSGGGLVSQNFNGNPVGAIGSPTQGFRLSSDAGGSSSDPNIYGAYIKGGTIDGALLTGTSLTINDIKVKADGYPSNYGSIINTTIFKGSYLNSTGGPTILYTDNSITYYASDYSSGHLPSRLCSNASSITLIVTWYSTLGLSANTTVYLERSINGGTFTQIASSAGFSLAYTEINFNTLGNYVVYRAKVYANDNRLYGSLIVNSTVLNGL